MELSQERLALFVGAGALGGLAGWAAAEPLAAILNVYLRAAFLGAVSGVLVGAFLGVIEGLSAGHQQQMRQGAQLGAVAGLVGGACGLLAGEVAFTLLGGLGGRIIGWGLFGLAVGLGASWVGRSSVRLRNGGIGGCVGGAVGGLLYEVMTALLPQSLGRGLALAFLGAAIGLGIGLVSEILKRNWLMVVRSKSRNAREGKEYPLTKPRTIIGRAEESDVGLFGDQAVAHLHAFIERKQDAFVLARGEGIVRVNQAPVTQPVPLKNGDRVEVGGTLFLFRERVAALLAALLLAGSASVWAAETAVVTLSPPRLDKFANGGAVELTFGVTDPNRQPISGVNPDSLEIREDGRAAQILDFHDESQGRRPVDIVVVFDITESMQSFIDAMREVTDAFADRLGKSQRDFRLGLVTFEDYVVREDPIFTRSTREFKSWVGALQATGGGDIPENSLDALSVASRFLFRPEAQGVLILITDAPNHFKGDGSDKTYTREVTQKTVDSLLAELKPLNLMTFVVGPSPLQAPDLLRIAKETGGRHYNISAERQQFPEVINEIGRSLASLYFVTYTSPHPIEDGTTREVTLKVAHQGREGEARVSYRLRGIGGARLTGAMPKPGEEAPPVSIDYAWWNIVIPLLAAGLLPLLARARVGALSAEVVQNLASRFTGPATTPNQTGEKPSPYARLLRQNLIDSIPREIAFVRDEMVFGRGERCDVVLPHDSVSSEHVRIKKLRPGYVIFDLKSRNGTYVDGRPIVENLLKDGMSVRIGEIDFIFRAASPTA